MAGSASEALCGAPHCPAPAELAEAGRFYLIAGCNEQFSLGREAWAGAPYEPCGQYAPADDDAAVLEVLGVFGNAPQVGDLAFSGEDERVESLTKMPLDEMAPRRRRLGRIGGDGKPADACLNADGTVSEHREWGEGDGR